MLLHMWMWMLVGAVGTTRVPSPVRVRQFHPRAHTRIGSSHKSPHDHLSPCTCTIYRALHITRTHNKKLRCSLRRAIQRHASWKLNLCSSIATASSNNYSSTSASINTCKHASTSTCINSCPSACKYAPGPSLAPVPASMPQDRH
jgi:hypothetical protein